jgi:fucose permease
MYLGGTTLLLRMWGENAAAPLNAAQFGYGIGAVVINLIVRPFLTQNPSLVNPINLEEANGTLSSVAATKANSNIVVPYTITAALCVLVAAGHIFFYIREQRNQRKRLPVREVMINQTKN